MRDILGSRARLLWILCAWALMFLARPAMAQEEKQQRALALYVTTPGAPGAAAFETVYQKELVDAMGSQLDFHSDFIDTARFSMPGYQAALADFLRFKYRHLPLDVVLATTEGARDFVERFRDDLFPGIPVVFIDRTASPRTSPQMTGVNAVLDLAGTVDLALILQPQTKQVVVVTGVSDFDRFYERLAHEQLQRFEGRVALTYLSDLSLPDLEQRLTHLPPDTIIYFLTLAEDAAGARFRTSDVRDRLALVANAPIYSWNSIGVGRGSVGGRLYSNAIAAERSAEVARRILRGEPVDTIPIVPIDAYVSQLDWRQMKRWHISEALVPAGTAVLFRELSLWDRYKAYIVSALGLILLQSALIAGLLVQRVRRRRTEAALRDHQSTLEARNTQISDLFGRLIAAQETERARLARDLHDDVSQRIAGLSLMISGLKRRLRGQTPEHDVSDALKSMQQSAIALADDIRDVSHDLHPSVLQHAGLVAALGGFCSQFGKAHDLAVTYEAGANVGHLPPDTALGLYRIAQEALRNVAKHAVARQVGVALTRGPNGIELSIADDGKGFDPAATRGRVRGLGLVSIDERARQLKGTVQIESDLRGGTRVRVQVP